MFVNPTVEEQQRRKTLWEQGYWEVPEGLDTTAFDFTWRPFMYDRPYIHQFGTQHQRTGGPKFVVPKSEGVKYQDCQRAIKLAEQNSRRWRQLLPNATIDFSWHPDETEPPFIYVFGNQWYDSQLMPTFQYRVSGATQKKYIDGTTATLLPNRINWEIPNNISDAFDYSWVPHPHEPASNWQFGTQHQRTGGPKFIMPNSLGIKYQDCQHAIHLSDRQNRSWRPLLPNATIDFTWHPNDTEPPFIYVFGNQWDTAEAIPTFQYRVSGATQKKYVDDIIATVVPDKIEYEDSIFDKFMSSEPINTVPNFTHFGTTELNYENLILDYNAKQIHIIDNVAALIPHGAKAYLRDKLTDYPYIKYHTLGLVNEPLDIIFISNGESIADENYRHLLTLTKDLPNRVIELRGVKGRVASQHAAANLSKTSWYFLINAKLRVDENFDFSWQPSRMVTAKHYVFRATNPVNGLVYGHQAIVANNKQLTLATVGTGLDFTLESPTEIVDVNSGIGLFNSSPWDTWRTAFREVLKLKHYADATDDPKANARLDCWLTTATGEHSQWCIHGATDAISYYEQVSGNFAQIKLSYDWVWLREYYDRMYPK